MPSTTTNPRFEKDPNSTRDFSVNWSDLLILKPGVSLSSVAVAVTPAGITVDSTSVSGAIGTARLSSGTAGTTYEARFSGTLSNGEIDVQRILIIVRKLPVGL